jgi:hypothetical protein
MTVSVRLGGRSDHVIGARFHPPRIDFADNTFYTVDAHVGH